MNKHDTRTKSLLVLTSSTRLNDKKSLRQDNKSKTRLRQDMTDNDRRLKTLDSFDVFDFIIL